MLLSSIAVAILALPAAYQTLHGQPVYGFNDMPEHVGRALAFDLWPPHPLVPHPGTHVLIRAAVNLGSLVGASVAASVLVLMLVGSAVLGAVVYLTVRGTLDGEGPSLGRRWAVAVTVACFVVESPRVLLDGVEMGPGRAFLPLQYLMGPTHTLSLPSALVLASLLVRFARVRLERRPPTRYLVALPVLVVAGAMLKPSFLQGAVFAVLPWIAWSAVRQRRDPRPAVAWTALLVVVPAVLTFAWQVWWLRNGMESAQDQTSIRLDVLGGYRAAGYGVVPLLACALPLAGVLVAGRRFVTEPKVALLGLSTLIGLAQFLLLNESGVRQAHGNLGKVLQTCLVMLSIEALRWTAAELSSRSAVAPARRAAAVALVGLFLAAGAAAWVSEVASPWG